MFTHEYFMQEARAFAEQIGSLSFWRLTEEQRDGALKGLLYVYSHVANDDAEQFRLAASFMELLLNDYTRREMRAPFHPKLQQVAA